MPGDGKGRSNFVVLRAPPKRIIRSSQRRIDSSPYMLVHVFLALRSVR